MTNKMVVSQSPLIREAVASADRTDRTIAALRAYDTSKTVDALIAEQKEQRQYHIGYLLGAVKANLDTLPEDIANEQTFNDIPLELFVKMVVDKNVLDIREKMRICEPTSYTDYPRKYRRLSEIICGFGYSMRFSEERFREYFPNSMHSFMLGFARGYSEQFHMLAEQTGVETVTTNPKTQDIWRNHEFFLRHDVHTYRLDGEFLYMYHGGFNCSDDPTVPMGNNVKVVNTGVYDEIRKRRTEQKPVSASYEFNFDI